MKKAIFYSLLASATLSACATKPPENNPPPTAMQHQHAMEQKHQMPMNDHRMHDMQAMHGNQPMDHQSEHSGMQGGHAVMHGEMPMHENLENCDYPKPMPSHNDQPSPEHMGHHEKGMGMEKPRAPKRGLPTEPGQGAFATIAEIVGILEADPNTDWSRVNISLLREHLVDMSNLSLYAQATQTRSENSIVFTITGNGNTLRAIQNMVPVHSMVVSQARGWYAETTPLKNGMKLTINSSDTDLLNKLEALGFFGFMSLENHHQSHHLQMATGNDHIHH